MRHLARAALLALCLASPMGAASAEDVWEQVIPTLRRGEITHLELLPGGDLLLAGSAALSTPSMTGGWIARFTPEGKEVWSEEFLGEDVTSAATLLVDSNRIYFSGSHIAQSGSPTGRSVFVAALAFDGETIWETWLTEPAAGIQGGALQKLANGDLLVKSSKVKKGADIHPVHYARLSPEGDVKWTYEGQRTGQYYATLPQPKPGVLGKEFVSEAPDLVIEQADGKLHFHIERSETFANRTLIGRCEAVTAKGVAIDGEDCPGPDQVAALRKDDVAPYAVNRFSPGRISAREITVGKAGKNGAAGWQWTYESDHRAGLTDAVLTPDGGLIGVGYLITKSPDSMHGYDAVIFRLAPDGKELWSQEYASPSRDIFARIVALGEDRYAVAGHTGVNSSTGEWDPWLLIIDGNGKSKSAVPKK